MDPQTHEPVPRRRLDVRSPHVVGSLPRSIYDHQSEARAMADGILMAAGNPRPVFVVGDRRVIGIAQGRSPFSPDVRWMRLPHRHQPRLNLRALKSFYEMPWPSDDVMAMAWPTDDNAIKNSIANGKYGRTQFAKTPTATGVAFRWYDLWPVTGNPGAGSVAGTAKTSQSWTDASTGAMNHRGNVSTDVKRMIARSAITNGNTPRLLFYDRVLSYDQNPYAAAVNQTMTNTITATRYNSGAPGCLLVMAVCTVNGATATNITQLRYTNQAGTTLQSMPTTPTVSIVVSGAAPTTTLGAVVIAPSSGATPTWGFCMPMAIGDTGMSLVNDYTPSAANTGTFTLYLMHPLTSLSMPIASTPFEMDCVYQIPEMEQIFDGACIAMMALHPATAGYTLQGEINFAWGT